MQGVWFQAKYKLLFLNSSFLIYIFDITRDNYLNVFISTDVKKKMIIKLQLKNCHVNFYNRFWKVITSADVGNNDNKVESFTVQNNNYQDKIEYLSYSVF